MSVEPAMLQSPSDASEDHSDSVLHWAGWSMTLGIIVLVFAIRLVYLVWFCPYELIGDEGYYWEQSRHIDWCYNEKGPALAWMIAASCKMFGTSEWAVRLPMLPAFILAAWGLGKLAMAMTRRDQRVGFLAVICFFLMPAFQANAQICTQDGVLVTITVALTAIGLRLMRRWREDKSTWAQWTLLWLVLGIGAQFKHTIVVFLPSVAIYALVFRRQLTWRWMTLAAQQAVGGLVFLLIISPMIYWNIKHHWPMLEHTLGHLGAGGDQTGQVNSGNPLIWISQTIGGIIGAFGPAAFAFMVWACIWAWKQRTDDPQRWADRFWLICAGWPAALFFVALSVIKPVVPSWPLPHLVPLMPLMAELILAEFAKRKQYLASAAKIFSPAYWRDAAFVWTWDTVLVYGLGAWLLISFPLFLGELPKINIPLAGQVNLGARLQHSILDRFTGKRQAAADLQAALISLQKRGDKNIPIVTRHYMQACLYAFYLPGRPIVRTAGKYLAKRSTTFDQWDDTRLDNPILYGHPLLLCGNGDVPWEKGLIYDYDPEKGNLANRRFFFVTNYQGPRPDYPRAVPGGD